jgi:hypothetical protein
MAEVELVGEELESIQGTIEDQLQVYELWL